MLHYRFTTTPIGYRRARIVMGAVLAIGVVIAASAYIILQTKILALQSTHTDDIPTTTDTPEPFPISVNPSTQSIETDPDRELYVETYARDYLTRRSSDYWFDQLLSRLSHLEWYQNLASPSTRIVVVLPGERKEQVTYNIGQILGWSVAERNEFLALMDTTPPAFTDGTLLPGRYTVAQNASPEAVFTTINQRFSEHVLARYPSEYEQTVPLHDALIIASLLEREAYDFTDMRVISGVIWNRLFSDMNLQIDATLQYARSQTEPGLNTWWPVPRPVDKFITSPYNTYAHPGLPPGPISNPHVASIIAALNPQPTECLFYFHDRSGGFHCSETYEQHVESLIIHYGQGR